jgi:hypothetical protein
VQGRFDIGDFQKAPRLKFPAIRVIADGMSKSNQPPPKTGSRHVPIAAQALLIGFENSD